MDAIGGEGDDNGSIDGAVVFGRPREIWRPLDEICDKEDLVAAQMYEIIRPVTKCDIF